MCGSGQFELRTSAGKLVLGGDCRSGYVSVASMPIGSHQGLTPLTMTTAAGNGWVVEVAAQAQ